VVTGAFTIEGFEVIKDLQLAVRGNADELRSKPLTVISCCPTSPLKWSDVTSQNVVDCARYSIPVEFISMPLSGFMAPVSLVGTLVQHTAETLSGVVISQLSRPGTPVLYGGSPAIFDMRYETTPMGAVETMMLDCAYSEIGKSLGMPTQGYISLSDSKMLDAQAGLESGIGATLAGLSGIKTLVRRAATRKAPDHRRAHAQVPATGDHLPRARGRSRQPFALARGGGPDLGTAGRCGGGAAGRRSPTLAVA
jgi:trimethylamine--corrinoid protein Co-methyltransferase